ncbi:MAG: hypothetical protein IJG52_01440 [Lachnospiraceae bacterium]|nr:hypothetical protein [Lachnospiraceae bacterium]
MNTASVFILLLLGFFILAALIGIRDRKRREAKERDELRRAFGSIGDKEYPEGRYSQLKGYWERHTRAFSLDDITWHDLDMDLLFHEMDRTCSAAGEEYLYWLLRSPALEGSERDLSEQQISLWREEEESLRLDVQQILRKYGKGGRYSVYEYLEMLASLPVRSLSKDLPAIVLPAVSVIVLFASRPVGVICLLLSLCFGMVTYFRDKGMIAPYLETVRFILRLLACGRALSGRMSGHTEASACFAAELSLMGRSIRDFERFQRGSWLLLRERDGSADPASLLLDYLCILFHLDLIKFGSMQRQLREQELALDDLITSIGRIDASVCIASYRKCLPVWCSPEPAEEGAPFVDYKGLYHPLLRDPVPNDFRAEGCTLLTGSNASGKSTFLKAAAVCAILAQTIRTAPAADYRARYMRIYTSMALRDSLQGGESYFIVEIRSLRRILDAARQDRENTPVLCCIDEVLRGTNTIERISASTEILHVLSGENMIVFAATHDLELTQLLEDDYENYHFSEEIVGEDVRFSYKIEPGPARTRNAIRLLQAMGYDKEIVRRAGERAEKFLKNGVWEKI